MTAASDETEAPIIGWIETKRTWPGIEETAWVRVISSVDGLEPRPRDPARTGINPFTKQPQVFAAKPADPAYALVVVDAQVVGEMRLVRSGPSEILVTGNRALVSPIARVAAAELGGRFVEMP